MKIGILALQGGYFLHEIKLALLGVNVQWVRLPQDLDCCNALILPGGESSAFLRLLQSSGLLNALKNFEKPILGTCAGAILLAKSVSAPSQPSLERIDIHITRNAYGRQQDSHISLGQWYAADCQRSIEMVFIRAPIINSFYSNAVKVLATIPTGNPVAIQQGYTIACCFHPELSKGILVHQYFIKQVDHFMQ